MPKEQECEHHVGVWKKPGSDVWGIRVTDSNGRRTIRKVGTYRDAVTAYEDHAAAKRLAAKRADIMPYIAITHGPKFSKVVSVALEFYESQGDKELKRFQSFANRIRKRFGNRVAATLTTMELENWLLDQADENEWSPATQNKYKFYLSAIFREGKKAKMVHKNPAELIFSAREANRRIRFFSEEEEQQIRQVIIERAKRFPTDWEGQLARIDLAIHTGMRKSEQFGLTWDRVYLDEGKLFLEKTKNGDSRDVFLNERAMAALLLMKERHDRMKAPPNALVFPEGSSTKWFDAVLEDAGIHDAVWYTLRHTTASRLVIRGVHISLVQTIMGHRTLRMTFRYAHLAAGHLLDAVEKIVPERKPFFGE